ncbi:MAG TPA: META domain-containing protein [Propionibacteriaceae bacterium]
MTDTEQIFRDGLDDAARKSPQMDPIELDEVIEQSRAESRTGSRSVTSGLLMAAAFVLIAGLGLGWWLSAAPGTGQRGLVAGPGDPTASSAPLIGPTWRLTEIGGKPAVFDASGGRGPDLTFSKKTISGTDGCNGLTGSYRLDGDKLKITDLISTLIGCDQSDALQKQQVAYGDNLNRSVRLAIDGSTLTLFDTSGTALLVFEAGSSPSPQNPTTVTTVQIRLQNESTLPMDDVAVTFADGKRVTYGSIAPGQRTSYEVAGEAYRYAYVGATIDGKERVLQPIDYVGETLLTPGRYTYVLTYTAGSLDLEFVTDQ